MIMHNDMATLLVGLLVVEGVVFCLAWSGYARFQYEAYGRYLRGLWDTGGDYIARETAYLELLTASDPRMSPVLRGQLWLFRLLLVVIGLAAVAFVFQKS